jgi:hypothetical protein
MNNRQLKPIVRSNHQYSVATDGENGVAVTSWGGVIVPFFSTEAVRDWDKRSVYKNLFYKAKSKYERKIFATKN